MHVVMESAVAVGAAVAFGVASALLAPSRGSVGLRYRLLRVCGSGRLAAAWLALR